jgi:release factor glutamine methyltransferase
MRAANARMAYRGYLWPPRVLVADFVVNPQCWCRPETELLVQRSLGLVGAIEADVADLGTGSGAIAIALAHERPGPRGAG